MEKLLIDDSTFSDTEEIFSALKENGWILLKDTRYDVHYFSELLNKLCENLTFDPARDYVSTATQKVDAGTEAVGLHIENGNTPLPPDIVAFFSKRSATMGSQTTVCDGAELLENLPKHLFECFQQPIKVARKLPEVYWKRYVASALKIDDIANIDESHLEVILQTTANQTGKLNPDRTLSYTLTITPILESNIAGIPAFANALLGPSYNYEKPTYTFESGEQVSDTMLAEVAAIAEKFTSEVQWQDGEVVIIDNKRVMHGRRKILVPLEERELIIGMGFLSTN